jgi:hypothetical protein
MTISTALIQFTTLTWKANRSNILNKQDLLNKLNQLNQLNKHNKHNQHNNSTIKQ